MRNFQPQIILNDNTHFYRSSFVTFNFIRSLRMRKMNIFVKKRLHSERVSYVFLALIYVYTSKNEIDCRKSKWKRLKLKQKKVKVNISKRNNKETQNERENRKTHTHLFNWILKSKRLFARITFNTNKYEHHIVRFKLSLW